MIATLLSIESFAIATMMLSLYWTENLACNIWSNNLGSLHYPDMAIAWNRTKMGDLVACDSDAMVAL